MTENPVSAVASGARTLLRGLFACWAGLTWGYAIASGRWPWEMDRMEWLAGWLGAALMPILAPLGWLGWLVLPFLVVMLFGAIFKEWNRWIVTGFLGSVTGAVLLVWSEDGLVSAVLLAGAVGVLLFGVGQEQGWFARGWKRVFGRNGRRRQDGEGGEGAESGERSG